MKRVLLLAIILLSLAISSGYCENQPLQLTIKSDKEVYEVGEEINIELAIFNRTKDNVKIYSPEYWGVSKIVVKNSKGDFIKSQFIAKVERASFEHLISIPSNETRAFFFKNLAWFGCGGLLGFNTKEELIPGAYNIYMTLINPPICVGHKYLITNLSGTLVSNTITIEVVKKK